MKQVEQSNFSIELSIWNTEELAMTHAYKLSRPGHASINHYVGLSIQQTVYDPVIFSRYYCKRVNISGQHLSKRQKMLATFVAFVDVHVHTKK